MIGSECEQSLRGKTNSKDSEDVLLIEGVSYCIPVKSGNWHQEQI